MNPLISFDNILLRLNHTGKNYKISGRSINGTVLQGIPYEGIYYLKCSDI